MRASALVLRDMMALREVETRQKARQQHARQVHYLSLEFLMGRSLMKNAYNLGLLPQLREALEHLGFKAADIFEIEPDAALGNGGLGRLAACFLDSLATMGYSAYGCGIRYRYGMFKQEIRDGYQIEVPDNWLMNGNPFELRRPEYAKIVKFGGYVSVHTDENGRNVFTQEGYQSVKAVPFDFPIVGYGNGIVNTIPLP